MACAINGTPVTKTFTATNTGAFPALTTTVSNCVLIVVVATEKSATAVQTVTSITDTGGHTWAKRSSKVETNQQNLEVWWAPAAASGATTITVNISANTDDASMIAFAVSGCADITSPWDPNVAIPAFGAASSTQDTVTGISTSLANCMLLMFCSNYNGVNYSGHAGTGYTMVTTAHNGGGARFSDVATQFKVVTATQSSVSAAVDNLLSSHNWVAIADALTSDANQRSAVAAQTVPDFTNGFTGVVIDVAVAAQNVSAFTQGFTSSAPDLLSAAQDIPAFAQEAVATLANRAIASQIVNSFPIVVSRQGNFVHGEPGYIDRNSLGGGASPRRVR